MVFGSTTIRLKDGEDVLFVENNINLKSWQIDKIRKEAVQKTKSEWRKSKHGIKIDLTPSQRRDILNVKNQVINSLAPSGSPKELFDPRVGSKFRFEPHAYERIIERLEPLTDDEKSAILRTKSPSTYRFAIHQETLEKTAEVLIKSNVVSKEAHWKAYRTLTYGFEGEYDQKKIRVVVRFDRGMVVVTLISIEEHGYYIGETKTGNKLKKEFFS